MGRRGNIKGKIILGRFLRPVTSFPAGRPSLFFWGRKKQPGTTGKVAPANAPKGDGAGVIPRCFRVKEDKWCLGGTFLIANWGGMG